jgi:hypothetical protein
MVTSALFPFPGQYTIHLKLSILLEVRNWIMMDSMSFMHIGIELSAHDVHTV